MFYKLLLQRLQTPAVLERMVAFALDAAICLVLCIIPIIGYFVGLIYFFLKDALPFTSGDSLGRHLYHLKLVDRETNQRITKGRLEKSIIRGLILFVPIINIIDAVYYIRHEHRLADEWVNTTVIKDEPAGE